MGAWSILSAFIQLLTYFEAGSYYVAQAGLELLGSSNPHAIVSQVTGNTDTCHCDWPQLLLRLPPYKLEGLGQMNLSNKLFLE